MATKYVADWSNPGCPPESGPPRFDSFADAVAHLIGLVDQFWTEDIEDVGELPDTRDVVNARWKPLRDALTRAAAEPNSASFVGYTGDRWHVFWIAPEFDQEETR